MTTEEAAAELDRLTAENDRHRARDETLLGVITDIRLKTGVGVGPMLSELADTLAADKAALTARVEELESESASRLKVLNGKSEESRLEWIRAENAEARVAELEVDLKRARELNLDLAASYTKAHNRAQDFERLLDAARSLLTVKP